MDNVIEKLTNANLGAVELNKYELVNIIKSIHNIYENDWSNEYIDKYKNNLDELLKISKITFAAEEIKLDGMHYAITRIRDYPLSVLLVETIDRSKLILSFSGASTKTELL